MADDETNVIGGHMAVSIWWVLCAFVGGGSAGIVLTALLRVSADRPEPSGELQALDSSLQ